MAVTTTFATLIKDLAETTAQGTVLPSVTGTTTGITLANAYAKGPLHQNRFQRGSPILTTAGTAINESTFVDTYVPSTGVFTIEPDLSNTFTECVIFTFDPKGIDHPDRVKEAINRALKRMGGWRMIPLTYVPDGDMLFDTIATYWTASAGTASYVSLGHPEVAAGRVVQLVHSSDANLESSTITARAGETWYFETAIRSLTAGATAQFYVQDKVANDSFTMSFEEGSGDTLSSAFVTQRGTFTVPGAAGANARIAFRLGVDVNGSSTVQMAPLIAYPMDAMSFPLQNRVERQDWIGNFHYAIGGGGNSGPDERGGSEPITTGGRTHSISMDADHMVVTFNFSPSGPVYYDEYITGTELSALTDTTTFPKERVLKWARYELYEWLRRRDNRWAEDTMRAKKSLAWAEHMQVPSITVYGRV